MHDDVHRPRDRSIAQDLVLRDIPTVRDIGEVGVADDDQQIIIGLIAILRLVDPVAARIAAKKDNFLDFAVLAVFTSGGKALLQQMRVCVPRSDT